MARTARTLIRILAILLILAAAFSPARSHRVQAQTGCALWQTWFFDGFDALSSQWSRDAAGGGISVEGGVLILSQGISDRFPLVWRNDLFSGLSNRIFAVEVRLAHEAPTAYGATVAIGNTAFGGSRYPQGDPYPIAHFENILMVHQYQGPDGNQAYARLLLGNGNTYTADASFHTVRIVVMPLGGQYQYDLYVDGEYRQSGYGIEFPVNLYFGNPFVMQWWGGWTTLKIDYVRIEVCTATPTPTRTPTPTPTPPSAPDVQPRGVCVEPETAFSWSVTGPMPTPPPTPTCEPPFCSPLPTPTPGGPTPTPIPGIWYPWELWRDWPEYHQDALGVAYEPLTLRLGRGYGYDLKVWAANAGGIRGPGVARVYVYPRVFNLWSSEECSPVFIWGYEGLQKPGSHFRAYIRQSGMTIWQSNLGKQSWLDTRDVPGLLPGTTYDLFVVAISEDGCVSPAVSASFSTCAPTPTPTPTPTRTPTPTPTPTRTPTPTPTPTRTPTPTPTPTRTPTPTPTPTSTPAPVSCTLSVLWPYLVWYGPNLPRTPALPAQTLYGSASPNAGVDLRVYSPADEGEQCNRTLSYFVAADSTGQYVLDPAAAAWPLFGTTCKGEWQAEGWDQNTGLYCGRVSWRVAWFPVHLRR